MVRQFLSGKLACCVQAAFLDLQRVDIPPQAGLIDAGPSGCLSGQLQMVQGQLGMPSQVYSPYCSIGHTDLHCTTCSRHGMRGSLALHSMNS